MKSYLVSAAFDFRARNDKEISFSKGEKFYVVDKDPFGVGPFASEWYKVIRKLSGSGPKEGLAPSNYFKVLRLGQKEMPFRLSTKR